ncbi:serine/threonine-protein kinase [Streptosporangium subroseum]|uniref:serine/threonine-protein kinase n=1 Tax=Streptosporangium subroseum TaxID=106412 RepID=UPI00308F8CE1|nr:protein kinase [Streptosporangium subroseum]
MNVIGGYVLRRELGRGGMGVVHLATTPAGGLAAVKVIHPQLAGDPDFRRRFDREVAAARSVARFCTAPVLDAGIEGGVAYLVTEYVKGPDLAQAVREQGPLSGADLEALAVGIATALHAIHGAGVIHRDLKPSNVLLSPLGPRVIDFGIAQLVDSQSLASQSILGTPAFMAPEQVRGEPLTPATDVYAWGGVIAFAGTGRLPFGGGSPSEVLYRIVNEGPNLDGLDETMRAVVERAMAKDPARRPSAQRLLDELIGGRPTLATATQVVEHTLAVARAPGALKWPDTPEPSAMPEPPAMPERPGTLEPPETPGPSAMPEPPAMSERPDTLEPSDIPKRPGTLEPPAMPGTRPAGTRRRWPWIAGAAALVTASAAGWAAYTLLGASALPYHADFSRSWAIGTSTGGGTEQDGGAYLLTANPGWRLWKSAPLSVEPAQDIVISSDMRLERGSGEFGVWCHGDEGTGDRYEFAVTGMGKASITKRHGGQSTVLHGPVQVRRSADSRVVARCAQRGERVALSMWLDDDLVSEAADTRSPYAPGSVGVYAAPDTTKPLRVRFRSFDVRPAEG